MKYLLIAILSFVCINAQETKLQDTFSTKPDAFVKKNYGKSILNVWYKFQFVNKSSSAGGTRESLCVLQIGNEYDKFTDSNFLKKDSILEQFSNKDIVSGKDLAQTLRYKELWPIVNLKNISGNKIFYQNRIRKLYEYEESVPAIKWKLESASKKILDYDCKKAIAKYRGREYVAWYTPAIPQSRGPYVFHGLPGLILEIEDSEKKYHFSAVAIDRNPMDIYMREDRSALKVSREKFREVQRSYYENPDAFHGRAYNEDGSQMTIKSKSIPYDPMELE